MIVGLNTITWRTLDILGEYDSNLVTENVGDELKRRFDPHPRLALVTWSVTPTDTSILGTFGFGDDRIRVRFKSDLDDATALAEAERLLRASLPSAIGNVAISIVDLGREVVVPTAVDVAEEVSDAATVGVDWVLPLVVVGLVALAAISWSR